MQNEWPVRRYSFNRFLKIFRFVKAECLIGNSWMFSTQIIVNCKILIISCGMSLVAFEETNIFDKNSSLKQRSLLNSIALNQYRKFLLINSRNPGVSIWNRVFEVSSMIAAFHKFSLVQKREESIPKIHQPSGLTTEKHENWNTIIIFIAFSIFEERGEKSLILTLIKIYCDFIVLMSSGLMLTKCSVEGYLNCLKLVSFN